MQKSIVFLIIIILACAGCKQNNNSNTQNNTNAKWWKEAVIYQLYPRSFMDSDGDGIGDLNGINQRLDYLGSLGIDAIWLNPICESPNDDNGYDISNYTEIMKEMGTMAHFDTMLAGMKKRNIKLIMDLVLNHSSDEHLWFKGAKSSRTNKYRNYYHWWPAEKGTPPKRYSLFDENEDAWRFDSTTNSYYLHYFSRKQPDLNWENPEVRQAFYGIMKFWLNKGVSGFRLDAFPFMAKDTTWPQMPKNFTNEQFVKYYGADVKVHKYLNEMYTQVLSKYDAYTVGEGGVIPFNKVLDYVNEDNQEINTLYHDEIANAWGRDTIDVGDYIVGRNNLNGIKQIVTKWDNKMLTKGWNTVYFGNHDQSRMVSKYGNDAPAFRNASAKMLHTFLLTQRATPYLYNGDEIGMTNINFTKVTQYNDLQTRNRYNIFLKESAAKAAAYLIEQQALSRDNGRTPMQWSNTVNAGFTTGTPWLTINQNYTNTNVQAQQNDTNSILNYVKKLTTFRRKNIDALVYGKYTLITNANQQVYAYTRTANNNNLLIILNFKNTPTQFAIPQNLTLKSEVVNNIAPIAVANNNITLQPYQAVIYKIK